MTGRSAIFPSIQIHPGGASILRPLRAAILLLILLVPVAASAQMTLISQYREVVSSADIFDNNTGDSWGWSEDLSSFDYLPFNEYLYADASESFGYTDSESSQESTLGPNSLWIASYAYTDAEIFEPDYTANSQAFSFFEVEFSIAQTQDWSLDGTLEAHVNGLVEIFLTDSFGNPILFQSWSDMFPPLLVAESGTLAPGTYTLTVNAISFEEMYDFGFYSASQAVVDLQFSVSGGTSPVGDNLVHDRYLNAGPNPMQNKTTIAFAGASDRSVHLDVYDLRGRLVRRLLDAGGSQGQVAWDGRNSSGQNVPQGIYFVRMRDGQDFLQRKVTVIR